MEVNEVPSKCPNQNCDYIINQTMTPILESFSLNETVLSLTISNYAWISFSVADITIEFNNIGCLITSFSLPSMICTFSNIPIGTTIPLVHIQKIGYLINNANLLPITSFCLLHQTIISNLCYNCDSTCKTCNGISSNSCTSCLSVQALVSGNCLNCDSSCQTCNAIGSNSCTSCLSSQALVAGSCLNCDSSCQTCNGSAASDCLSCFGTMKLYNGSCFNCDPSCQTCDGESSMNCISCLSNQVIIQGGCVNCDLTCKTCSGISQFNCLSCPFGKLFYLGSCFDSCPTGLCVDFSGISCQNCTSCAIVSQILYQNKCLDSCPDGTYYNIVTKTCNLCDSKCQKCSNFSNNCTSCISTLNLFEKSCLEVCPLGTLMINNICFSCFPSFDPNITILQSFCQNITNVNFTVQEIRNPTSFKIVFSAEWPNLNLVSLNKSISIAINKIDRINYNWTLTSDFFSPKEFYLTISYQNVSFQKGDNVQMTLSVNSSLSEKNFVLVNTVFKLKLLSLRNCLRSNEERYNSSKILKNLFFNCN